MKPKDFLDTAAFLMDFDPSDPRSEPTEADCRTAVGRAYYASFLDARDLLESMGFHNLDGGNTHHLVKQYLDYGGKRARKIAGKLSNLHQRRKNADYDIPLNPAFFPKDAQLAMRRADEIIKFISDCHSNSSLKSLVESGIRVGISNP